MTPATTQTVMTGHVVAIIGGATAGSEAARVFADAGIRVIVFDQNQRPYGKVEDGLPRWHINLRHNEFAAIDSKLDRREVEFVPMTKVGRDISLTELLDEWGFHAVILANGAWRDRPLPIPEIELYVGKGLLYQNSLIYWFNHFEEPGYAGPDLAIEDGAIVVGGGLASIDVIKVLQLELTRRSLAARGIDAPIEELDHQGIPKVLASHGLGWEDLGLVGARLFYRRRIEDMPLAESRPDATEAAAAKIQRVRLKIVEKARAAYLFQVIPLHAPIEKIVEAGRLVGLVFEKNRVVGDRLERTGERVSVRSPLTISSIGSVPEAIGVPMKGELYAYSDWDLGKFADYPNLFSVGNVVTGKGNLVASRKHAGRVAKLVAEQLTGVVEFVRNQAPHGAEERKALDARVRRARERVGYSGHYGEWIAASWPESLPQRDRGE